MTQRPNPPAKPTVRVYSRREAIKMAGVGVGGSIIAAACGDGSETAATSAAGANTTAAAQEQTINTVAGPSGQYAPNILFDYGYGGTPGSMGEYYDQLKIRFEVMGRGRIGDLREVGYDEMYPAIQAAHAAKEGPDLESYYPNFNTFQFFTQGVLHPMDPYVGGKEEINHWKFKGVEFNGEQYNSPFYAEIGMMAYNKEIFQKAGVEVGDRFESWDDFISAAQKIKAVGEIPIIIGAADGFNSEKWVMAGEMEFLDDPLQLTDWNAGRTPNDSQIAISWIDRLGQIIHDGLVNPDAGDITEQEAVELFGSGVGGMYIGIPATLFALDDAKFDIVGYWKGPGKLSAPITTGGSGLVLTNFGDATETAGDFVKFMHEPSQLQLFNELTSELPCDERFDPSGLAPLPAKVWSLLSSDPEPIWVHDFIHIDTILNIYYALAPELIAGAETEDIKARFLDQMDQWRERNPDNVANLESFADTARG